MGKPPTRRKARHTKGCLTYRQRIRLCRRLPYISDFSANLWSVKREVRPTNEKAPVNRGFATGLVALLHGV
jgi:hypothetical protein